MLVLIVLRAHIVGLDMMLKIKKSPTGENQNVDNNKSSSSRKYHTKKIELELENIEIKRYNNQIKTSPILLPDLNSKVAH